tara:strand:- start:22416 stop:23450 length:1035 start_codon:yes stop_codon:yes gene_type:complete
MLDNNFALELINWYKLNKRDLPWRETSNPYYIWLSEIILQQTRVEQGMPYYIKFVNNFPNIFDLANASERKILSLWQGLGYYSRARNLHFTAKYIANELNGKFPNSYNEIIKLKGVGKYTAAAISSFAFNEKKAVLDGNVYRLLSRYFGISDPIDTTNGQKNFSNLADKLIPLKKVDTYNQAIMEFGALQCKPKNPKCNSCPLNTKCCGLKENMLDKLPIKSKRIQIKKRNFNYLVLTDGDSICLEKRVAKDIWQNMYQFPMIEEEHQNFNPYKIVPKNAILLKKSKCNHLLTHQKISANFWHFMLEDFSNVKNLNLIKVDELNEYPVPKIVENYIQENLAIEV